MTKLIAKAIGTKAIGTFQKEDANFSKRRCSWGLVQEIHIVIQILYHPENKLANSKIGSVNVRALKSRSGETGQMLERSSVGIYCIQETRFRDEFVILH